MRPPKGRKLEKAHLCREEVAQLGLVLDLFRAHDLGHLDVSLEADLMEPTKLIVPLKKREVKGSIIALIRVVTESHLAGSNGLKPPALLFAQLLLSVASRSPPWPSPLPSAGCLRADGPCPWPGSAGPPPCM